MVLPRSPVLINDNSYTIAVQAEKGSEMVKITLGKLKDKSHELVEFLGKRVPESAKPTVSGEEIVFENDEGIKTRELKTYLKRFLYNQKMRNGFRVRVVKDTLELVEVIQEQESEE